MDLNVIIAALALLLGLPFTALVWRVGYHMSEIRRLSHESSLRIEETRVHEASVKSIEKAKSESIIRQTDAVAYAEVSAKERAYRLEQTQKKNAIKTAEEEKKKADKAAALQRKDDEAKALEKKRRDIFEEKGHQLWRVITGTQIILDKYGYRTGKSNTTYSWHCTCGQKGKTQKEEWLALSDFADHQEFRETHVGFEYDATL